MDKVNLADKLSQIQEHWRPKVVGEFVWHHHDHEDELFLGVRGRFRVEFRDRNVEMGPGEFIIVPRGIEHRTVADEEAEVLIFEPGGVRNTGNVEDPVLTAPKGVKI
jgi:quercetin dioxygenase-like cupin family protein